MNKWLFVFRQDIRLQDNTALTYASKECDELLPIFVFDTHILKKFPSPDKRLWFLVNALEKLNNELVSAWSTWADEEWITIKQYADYLLVEPQYVVQMKVFTPFYKRRMWKEKRWELYSIESLPQVPIIEKSQRACSLENKTALLERIGGLPQTHRDVMQTQSLLEWIDVDTYDDTRNFPSQEWTSKLSPYFAFGLVSPRQALRKCLTKNTPWVHFSEDWKTVTMDKKIFKSSYVSELARREYWQHVAYYFPETRTIEFQEKRQWIQRINKKERFEAWKNWETGYPIVDAAMKQLKEENRMHGRCRMIVASFLTKDLLIDWRRWEEHFKNHLLDYDKSINIGNRQRSASVWPDPKPLRIFNPILQSQRFDPNANYIKKWLPELEGKPTKSIHDPIKYDLDYIKPIVDHYVTSKLAKKMYYKEPISLENAF